MQWIANTAFGLEGQTASDLNWLGVESAAPQPAGGVLFEGTEYPELEKARRLAGFYKRHGWCETGIPYAIGGREPLLLHRGEAPQRADLRGVLEAVYAPMYGPKFLAKHVSLP